MYRCTRVIITCTFMYAVPCTVFYVYSSPRTGRGGEDRVGTCPWRRNSPILPLESDYLELPPWSAIGSSSFKFANCSVGSQPTSSVRSGIRSRK